MSTSPLQNILDKLQVKHSSNGEYSCICPAHDDRQASLCVSQGDDGRVLMHCQAGCAPNDVLAAMELRMRDLYPKEQTAPKSSSKKPNATYPYVDPGGKLLYQILRFVEPDGKKRFVCRRPDPDNPGKWIWKKSNTPVPYQLPTMLKAIKKGICVFIVEGEKDVESLHKIGIVATCNPFGAGKWQGSSLSAYFQGAHVVLVPDNDVPGCKHMMDVGCQIHQYAASIKYLQLPDLKPKGDVSDFLMTHSKEEFVALAENAPRWIPGTEIEPSEEAQKAEESSRKSQVKNMHDFAPGKRPLTDSGNAERLIDAHCKNLRFNVDSGKWLIWNDQQWKPDHLGEIDRLALATIRGMYSSLAEAGSSAEREAIFKHIQKSESAPRLAAMVSLARTMEGIPVRSSDLDADSWLLNCKNGTIDLRTGELRPHDQKDLITKTLTVDYDSNAQCPRWMQFLAEVFQNDQELIDFVKRMSGYVLTGDTREECLFILTGKGQNGKSKAVETMRAILGDYAQDTPVTTLTERRDANTFDLPALAGSRLVTAAEGDCAQSFNESLLKRLTGNDPITACFKFRDYFTYVPTFKILLSTNEVPRIKSQNYAMKRRIKLIPFRQRFYEPEDGMQPVKDPLLKQKLLSELPGILRWMVDGCLEWQRAGLLTPAVVRHEVNRLFDDQDPLAEFIEAECLIDLRAEVQVSRLWEAYRYWCESNNRQPALRAPQSFSRSLSARDGIEQRKGTGGTRFLTGIKLIGDPNNGDSGDNRAFLETYPHEEEIRIGLQNCPNTATSAITQKRWTCPDCGRFTELHDCPEVPTKEDQGGWYRYICICGNEAYITHRDYIQWITKHTQPKTERCK